MTDLELLPNEASAMAPEQRLVVAVVLAAWRDAQAGKEDAVRFLTDRHGPHAEARRCWIGFTSLDEDLVRRQCCKVLGVDLAPKPALARPALARPAPPEPKQQFKRADFYAGRTLERCRAGSHVARLLDLLSQCARTYEELCSALNLTEDQVRNAFWQANKKGYGFATCRDTGRITLEYPRGHDRPLPHIGTLSDGA